MLPVMVKDHTFSSKALALQLLVMFICISKNSDPQIIVLLGKVSNLALQYWQHSSDAFLLLKQPLREMTHSPFFIVGDNIKRGIFIPEVKASICMNPSGIK